MIKYTESLITFSEIPTEIVLSLGISNCQNHCEGCHSPYMRDDVGTPLSKEVLDKLLSEEDGVSCVLFLGEGRDSESLFKLADHVRKKGLKSAVYSGRVDVEREDFSLHFDYVKTGPYVAKYGPLTQRTTNQRLYHIHNGQWEDITGLFWKDSPMQSNLIIDENRGKTHL